MKRLAVAFSLAALLALTATDAGGWGSTGHRMVGMAAMRALPEDMPAFLRTPSAATDVGEYAREPDRWKGAGRTHDRERDTAHFIDLTDDGHALTPAGPHLDDLPELRSEYERMLTEAGLDVDDAGWLPYAMIDGWQQLVRDFAYWRVLNAAEARETDHGRRAWYRSDRERREFLLLRDIGVLGHYVGDASQPLHLSVHYNGWGDHPNPEGFTLSRQTHGLVEGEFVPANVAFAEVESRMGEFAPCGCHIRERTAAYIARGLAQVIPLYRLEQQGGFTTRPGLGGEFVTDQLASGATELRDLIVEAWRASATVNIGWPAISVAEVEAGTIDPWNSMVGTD